MIFKLARVEGQSRRAADGWKCADQGLELLSDATTFIIEQ